MLEFLNLFYYNLNKSTEGLLKTSFGVKKSDIYKEEIFSKLSDKEIFNNYIYILN